MRFEQKNNKPKPKVFGLNQRRLATFEEPAKMLNGEGKRWFFDIPLLFQNAGNREYWNTGNREYWKAGNLFETSFFKLNRK